MNCPHQAKLRPELPQPLPPQIAKLPLDERGYPVPWFVAWIKGKPEFRCADGEKFTREIATHLCWVCGEKIKGPRAFVIGPICGEGLQDLPRPRGKRLFRLAEPQSLSWWAEGREATRAEVLHSIDTGLPLLRQACLAPRDFEELETRYREVCDLLPGDPGSLGRIGDNASVGIHEA